MVNQSINQSVSLTPSMPRDQELHALPSKPTRRPSPGNDFRRENGKEDGRKGLQDRKVCRQRVQRGSWEHDEEPSASLVTKDHAFVEVRVEANERGAGAVCWYYYHHIL